MPTNQPSSQSSASIMRESHLAYLVVIVYQVSLASRALRTSSTSVTLVLHSRNLLLLQLASLEKVLVLAPLSRQTMLSPAMATESSLILTSLIEALPPSFSYLRTRVEDDLLSF